VFLNAGFFVVVASFFSNDTALISRLNFGLVNIVVNDISNIYASIGVGNNNINYDSLMIINLVHKSILVFLIAIWQALIIFKMLLTKPSVSLSNILCYYKKQHRMDEQNHNSFVFRLVNLGRDNLFRVKISAQLSIKISDTFRYYDLNVTSPIIPIFEPDMPYRIFIKTGIVDNVGRKAYLLTDSDQHELEENKFMLYTLIDNHGVLDVNEKIDMTDPKNKATIIVMVEVFDDLLDQEEIILKRYAFHEDLRTGKFKDILPSDDTKTTFDRDVILSSMNALESTS
jgi:hypothetical protein